jgi:hypothetical protein
MRSENVIASSWRALVLPPCPRNSISTLVEICGRFCLRGPGSAYHCGCLFRRPYRGRRCGEPATEAPCPCHRRTMLRLNGSRQRMIASQLPPPSVFIRAQAMASADVAAECLAPIAAIKAHHIIPVYGTAHRHRRGPNLLRLTRLSKLTDRPMNGGNQIGMLIRPQPLVPDVAHHDFRR